MPDLRLSETSRWGERFTDRELITLSENLRRGARGLSDEIALELHRRGYTHDEMMGWLPHGRARQATGRGLS